MDTFVSFLILANMVSVLLIWYNVALILSYSFYCVVTSPSVPSFLRAFVMKGYWILSKDLFCIYWDYHGIFVPFSICVLYYVYWFVDVEPFLHPCNENNMITVWVFLMCCLVPFENILLRILVSMFIKEIGLQFSFLLCSYLVWVSG
jgi:hypothetical protein